MGSKTLRYFALVWMLSLFSIGSSQADPWGTKTKTVGNALFKITLAIPRVTADNHKISGTRVPVTCTGTAQVASGSDENPVGQVRLKHVTLTIGGNLVLDDLYTVSFADLQISDQPAPVEGGANEQGGSGSFFPDVRDPRDPFFASTKFPHNTVVPIVLTVTFRAKRQGGQEEDVVVGPLTISPKAYNRVTMWRTYVTVAGGSLNADQEAWTAASYDQAKGWHEDANYAVSATTSATKSQLLTDFSLSTGLFGITHGSATDVTDSTGVGAGHSMTWSEIETGIGDRYSVLFPPVSHAFMYACQTIPNMAAAFFWLWREPLASTGDAIDSASYGFNKSYGFCIEEHLHIDYLFNKYDQGHVAYWAVKLANDNAGIPELLGPRGSKAPLIVEGDSSLATFKHVYLSLAVREALTAPYYEYANWKWVAPYTP